MPACQGLPRAQARTAPLRPVRTVLSGRSGPVLRCPSNPSLTSPLRRPGPRCPPSAVTMLAGDRPGAGAPRARLPEGWRLPGVYSCPSAAAGLSRVLGRRSAPGSGSNCEPGVRQPSSRDRGPGAGALRRPGMRAAEGSPVASGGRAPSENPNVGPAGDELNAAAELPPRLRKLRRRAAHARHRRRRRPLGQQPAGRGLGSVGLLCAAVRVARLPSVIPPACLILRTPGQRGAGVSSKRLDLSCRAPESILSGL